MFFREQEINKAVNFSVYKNTTLTHESLVYVKFPKTGLGNMLLLWARALVFARLNNLELITSGWFGFRWGALLRREKKTRLYWRYFRESSFFKRMRFKYFVPFSKVVVEPKVEMLPENLSSNNTMYLFNKVMTGYDLFGPLRNHTVLIRDELFKMLHPSKKSALQKFEQPVIGIHIRRGDFNLGSTVTLLSFFIEGIKIIRKEVGEEWPVTVFTDAAKEEIAELLNLPAVKLAEKKADILDIILLGTSKVLLLSATSTFSYFAAFLSNAFVVMPANDWLGSIKNNAVEKDGYFEMKWQYDDELSTALFKENINSRQLKTGQ